MKKDNLIKGAAVLGTIALMAGGVIAADAANTRSANRMALNGEIGNGNQPVMLGLSEEEKAEKIEEMTARRTENRLVAEERQAEMATRRPIAQAALEANDFTTWQEAMGDHPLADKITAENFDRLVEAHNLMQAGNVEAAKAIFAELGWENGNGLGLGNGGERQGLGRGVGKGMGHMFNQ